MSPHWEVIAAPLLVGLLVVSTHVVFGRRVLERGIIFIDLTIAQVAALGVVLAGVLGMDESALLTQLAAATAALLAAALLAWTEQRYRNLQEALIGSLYVLAASVAVLLLANNPHGAERMQSLLSGQILWVSMSEVWPLALLYAAVLLVWQRWASQRPAAFYFLFAITVTASVQLVGVYLVFATLILPAIATSGMANARGLITAAVIGSLGYAFALWLSLLADLPAGPLAVCCLAALSLTVFVARRIGRKHAPNQ